MEITEQYLDWRSRPSGKNREEHLATFVRVLNEQSVEMQLKTLELLYDDISSKKPKYYRATQLSNKQLAERDAFHRNRFMRGVTLLEWGNLSVVEDIFVDRAWLFKTTETFRFAKHFNLIFEEVLGGLLLCMTDTQFTFPPKHDKILLKWFTDNRGELIWDEEKRKFLITQFEKELKSK